MDDRKREVSKELDSYLQQRKKEESSWSNWFGSKPAPKPALAQQVTVYDAPEAGAEKVEPVAPDTTTTESAIAQEYEETRSQKSLIHTLLGKFKRKPTQQAQEAIEGAVLKEEGELQQDLQQLARITLRALKRLPSEELAEYKTSEDFTMMKELLRKHHVIK